MCKVLTSMFTMIIASVCLSDCSLSIIYCKCGHIKTHDSESRGQEEVGRTRRTSELLTGSTALSLVNALNKPP